MDSGQNTSSGVRGSAAAILTDVVHNLRAALDYLVYRLAVIETRADPPPHYDRLAFPVCETAQAFEQASRRNRGPISDGPWATIEQFQPYRTHPENVRLNSFYVLRELDDIGKHRDFPLATTALGPSIRVNPPSEGFEIHGGPDVGPWERNSQLLTYRTPSQDLRLGFEVDYELWFAKREPFLNGYPVSKALDTLRADVEVVVGAFSFTDVPPTGPSAGE